MSDFTYQKSVSGKLETYEWDNVWWEQTSVTDIPRVLYIGDSISCGIRRICTEKADGKFLFDGFGTSKAVDNPYFCETLKIFAMQQGKRKAVLFNNGLHGWHLSDEEYEKNMRKIIGFIDYEIPSYKTIIVLTTAVTDTARNEVVIRRNKIAEKIAEDLSLPIIDLNKYSVEYSEHHCSDGVHFDETGCNLLATALVNEFEKIMVGNE